MTNKSGRLTDSQKAFILQNYEKMPVTEIAANIEKNRKTVADYIKKNIGGAKIIDAPDEKLFSISKSPIWKEIQQQLAPNEIDTFLYHWNSIQLQFKNDILATEKMQVVELCRIEVLINRTLKKMKEVDITVYDLRKSIDEEKNRPIEERDLMKLDTQQALLSDIFAANINFTKEYKDLADKKQQLMSAIRGSRDLRIKRIEDSKETLVDWVKSLLERPELREKMGRDMEKFRIACEFEAERLSDYHTFLDGTVERPLLTPDTVGEDD